MTTDPQAARYAPDTPITALQDRLADPVVPADFPKTILRFRNRRWDKAVDLDQITDAEWVAHRFFFDWRGGRRRQASPDDALNDGPAFAGFVAAIGACQSDPDLSHRYWAEPAPARC